MRSQFTGICVPACAAGGQSLIVKWWWWGGGGFLLLNSSSSEYFLTNQYPCWEYIEIHPFNGFTIRARRP